MKITHLFFGFLMLLVPCLCLAGNAANEAFMSANDAYGRKDYKQAQAAYVQLINSGYQSDALYYNMGNACYKTGDIASALLYYERARKLSPGDNAVNFNISLANSKTVDRADLVPEFFLTRWWHKIILSSSSGALAVISILLFFIASACLILYFFSMSFAIKKYSFFAAIAIFLAGIVLAFIAAGQVRYFDNHKEAIVFESVLNIKNKPGIRSETVFEVHSGTKITVLKNTGGWLRVRLLNGHEGWVQATGVKEI